MARPATAAGDGDDHRPRARGRPAGVVGAEAGERRLASRRDASHCRRPQPGRAAQRRDVLSCLGGGADPALDAAAVVVRAGGRAPLHRLGRGAARAGAPRPLGTALLVAAVLVLCGILFPLGPAGLLRQDDLRAAGAGGRGVRRPGAQQRAAFHQPRRPRAHGRTALQGRSHPAPAHVGGSGSGRAGQRDGHDALTGDPLRRPGGCDRARSRAA